MILFEFELLKIEKFTIVKKSIKEQKTNNLYKGF